MSHTGSYPSQAHPGCSDSRIGFAVYSFLDAETLSLSSIRILRKCLCRFLSPTLDDL
jgi:hypothetical protein